MKAKRAVSKQEAKMAKLTGDLNKLSGILPSHPLDEMYDPTCPPMYDFKDVDVSEVGWETDVIEKGWQMADVALALFKHYDLITLLNIDETVLKYFLSAMEVTGKKGNAAFHNNQQSAQMMCCVHHLIAHLKTPLNMMTEDIFSVLLAVSTYNVGHEGVDEAFLKRGQSMLSMLYSDLYANAQNNATAAFELMGNPNMNILANMSSDGARDIAETVREIIVIKANVAMATEEERIQEFTALIESPECDWNNKDNQRIALTHMVSLVHWSCWGQPHNLACKWTKRLAEEFYAQGEREIALGLMASNFNGTNWTTDAARHDADFAAGMVEIIDAVCDTPPPPDLTQTRTHPQVVLPLARGMNSISKEFQHVIDSAMVNKEKWEQDGGGDCAQAQKAIAEMGWLYRDVPGGVFTARPGPDGLSLWLAALNEEGQGFSATFDESLLSKKGTKVVNLVFGFDGDMTVEWGPKGCTAKCDNATLELPETTHNVVSMMMREIASSAEIRGLEKLKDLDKKTSEFTARVKQVGNKSVTLYGEEKVCLPNRGLCLEVPSAHTHTHTHRRSRAASRRATQR